MIRTIAIWICGIFASGLIGNLIASRIEPTYADTHWGLTGGLAGIFTFACLRLWFGEMRSKKSE
jgi:hypothetical protein